MSNAPILVVDWPTALVKELADRRAILVLGSGLSATAVAEADPDRNPPTWRRLISEVCTASVPSTARGEIEELVTKGKLIEAAEEISSRADKQSLAQAIRSALVDPHFKASQAHSDIMTIDQPIVVNLNYDRIFENQCIQLDGDSYVVTHYYGDDFIRNIRSPLRVVLKLHGSVDDPEHAVFSMSDYARARTKFDPLLAFSARFF